MKRLISMLLVCVMLTALLPQVMAEKDIIGVLKDGVLTVSGTGEITEGSVNVDPDLVRRIVIEEGITGIGEYAFWGFWALTEIELPDSLERIGSWAFAYCTELEEVFLPAGVKELHVAAFEGNERMKAIRVAEENAHFFSDDRGVLYSKDKSLLMLAPCGISGKYEILEGTKRIGEWAFASCVRLQEVTIPDGLTHIEKCAFSCCERLARAILDKVCWRSDLRRFAGANLWNIWRCQNPCKASEMVRSVPAGASRELSCRKDCRASASAPLVIRASAVYAFPTA